MTRFIQIFPILTTTDLVRLADFYTEAVDAKPGYEFAGDDGSPAYVSLAVAGGHLGIGLDPSASPGGASQRGSLWFYTDDCDAAYGRLLAAGATPVNPPDDMAWGERVAEVSDPDGNLIHLGQAAPA